MENLIDDFMKMFLNNFEVGNFLGFTSIFEDIFFLAILKVQLFSISG